VNDITKLTAEYQERGFCVLKQAVSHRTLVAADIAIKSFAADHMLTWRKNLDPDGLMRRVTNMHLMSTAICDLVFNSSAIDVADEVFGARAAIYTSLFFEGGSQQPIHRDAPYFHTNPVNSFVGCWVALEDADDTNGALEVVVGGHRIGDADLIVACNNLGREKNKTHQQEALLWEKYQKGISEEALRRALEHRVINVERGDVIIWHPLLPHGGSTPTQVGKSRRSLVFHLTPEGVPVGSLFHFFDRAQPMPRRASWGYRKHNGRSVAEVGNSVQFAHRGDGTRDEITIRR